MTNWYYIFVAFATLFNMSTAYTGRLYIVATPIGNISDISNRALEVLRDVAVIASEDTRETAKILEHFAIKTSQVSYREQNHARIAPFIIETLTSGKNVALVSDSGTPLISDPGYKLVKQAVESNITVEAIPGPSAIISALSISGLPTDKFSFLGFLPRSSGERKNLLQKYGNLDNTLVIYESPFRVYKLLQEILEHLGNRQVCVANDLTKKFEKVTRGTVSEVIALFGNQKLKGEYVVLVGKEGL
jgi:16S rRNA (cytidine1402-2'-O)-methyltransferase